MPATPILVARPDRWLPALLAMAGRFACASAWLVVATLPWAATADDLTFERHIRPIFRAHCFDCHGANEAMEGGLDLRLVRSMVRGGESGPAIVPGDAEQSYLLNRVRSGEMPPDGSPVPEPEVAILEAWIQSGARTAREEPESIGPGLGITPDERNFWAFQPIRRGMVVPNVEGGAGTAVDAFLLQPMPSGVGFSPAADRATLVRRAYADLVGLPPSREEIERWLHATHPEWFAQLVDELLASPHYGERWARHWLDIAGYADSEGYDENDTVRPWAWKYRDWVVDALNRDTPFDQFLTEQLAGDELAGPWSGLPTPRQIELLTATGFLRMAADGTGGADTPESRNHVLADTLKIVGSSVLALSIQCAQCHDHRYDPIPQTDYYALRAIFDPALDSNAWKRPSDRLVSLLSDADRAKGIAIEAEVAAMSARRAERQAALIAEQLEKQLMRVEDLSLHGPLREAFQTDAGQRTLVQNELLASYPFVRQLSPGSLYLYDSRASDELKRIDEQISILRQQKPHEEFLRVLVEPPDHLPVTHLFYRGDYQQPKQEIRPGSLQITVPEGESPAIATDNPTLPSSGRRLAFARSLARDDHPLVARVIVNRVWLHHFGRGIVSTPADFGKLGAHPSHPLLLDWLADQFQRDGWSLKRLHRRILTSNAWQQSSHGTVQQTSAQATSLYARKSVQRLDAEVLRDHMLAAAGQLQTTLHGPPVEVNEDESGQVVVSGPDRRRSLYLTVRRSRPVAILQAFDAPVMQTNCEVRPTSIAASQSLMLLNGEFILRQAALVARRVVHDVDRTEDRLLRVASALEELAREKLARDGDPTEPSRQPNLPPDKHAQRLGMEIIRSWEIVLARRPDADELRVAIASLQAQVEFMSAVGDRLPEGRDPHMQALTTLCQTLLSCNEFLYVE